MDSFYYAVGPEVRLRHEIVQHGSESQGRLICTVDRHLLYPERVARQIATAMNGLPAPIIRTDTSREDALHEALTTAARHALDVAGMLQEARRRIAELEATLMAQGVPVHEQTS